MHSLAIEDAVASRIQKRRKRMLCKRSPALAVEPRGLEETAWWCEVLSFNEMQELSGRLVFIQHRHSVLIITAERTGDCIITALSALKKKYQYQLLPTSLTTKDILKSLTSTYTDEKLWVLLVLYCRCESFFEAWRGKRFSGVSYLFVWSVFGEYSISVSSAKFPCKSCDFTACIAL